MWQARAALHCGVRASRGSGSCCYAALSVGRSGLSSCRAPAQLPQNAGDLPRSGVKTVSPALAGGFLTTGLLGKSLVQLF